MTPSPGEPLSNCLQSRSQNGPARSGPKGTWGTIGLLPRVFREPVLCDSDSRRVPPAPDTLPDMRVDLRSLSAARSQPDQKTSPFDRSRIAEYEIRTDARI